MFFLQKILLTFLKSPIPSVGLSEPMNMDLIKVGDVGDRLFWIGDEGDRLLDCGMVVRLSATGEVTLCSLDLTPLGFGNLIVIGGFVVL